MNKRAWGFFGLLVVCFMGLGLHFWFIATDSAELADVGGATRTLTVASSRGTIYDRNLIPLVNATSEYRAAILPNEELLSLVSGAMSTANYLALLERVEKGELAVARLTKPVPLAQGMRLFLTPLRYGESALAPHIIGYLDESGQQGITGVESAFNEILSAYSGLATATFSVNGNGRYIQTELPTATNTLNNKAGGVSLTLDSGLQALAEECEECIEKGALVLLDGDTGEWLAGVSFPSFHPLSVDKSIQENDGALINRTLSLYDCGSVFKIVTVAAALEGGISPNQTYPCNGGLTVGNTVFHCHDRLGHQTLDMYNAFAESCNLYFIQLAEQIGESALLDMARRLGLCDEISPIDGMRASAGVFPTKEELSVPAALANLSFGQGKLLLSPLHIARMTGIIANGGYLQDIQLLKGYVDINRNTSVVETTRGERVLCEDTVFILQAMMRAVVEEGTGQKATVEGCSVAGKTGTAQTGQYSNDMPVIQSWFTGYFTVHEKRYVITVLAENSETTSKNAAIAVCEFINKLLESQKEQTN